MWVTPLIRLAARLTPAREPAPPTVELVGPDGAVAWALEGFTSYWEAMGYLPVNPAAVDSGPTMEVGS